MIETRWSKFFVGLGIGLFAYGIILLLLKYNDGFKIDSIAIWSIIISSILLYWIGYYIRSKHNKDIKLTIGKKLCNVGFPLAVTLFTASIIGSLNYMFVAPVAFTAIYAGGAFFLSVSIFALCTLSPDDIKTSVEEK